VRPLGNIRIEIDGDFSDWPLDSFERPSEQPLFPEGQESPSTDASGDHIVFDPERVGRFNGTGENAWMEGPADFGCTLYFAYDEDVLYILAVFIDDILAGSGDPGGCQNFLNDGFEFLIDALDDSNDCATDFAFPAFDAVEPNIDDFQITAGLNDFFLPENPGDDDLGARQHMERAGTVEAIEGGNPCIEPSIYRELLDDLEVPSVAARAYADLRAAGARNPEILAHPEVTYPGYALEMIVPFGWIAEFDPAENPSMGFEMFWRDVDAENDPGAGVGQISWASWAQSTDVPCDGAGGPGVALFQTSNWGRLVFVDDPLGGGAGFIRGDCNASGRVDLSDAIFYLGFLFLGGTAPSCADACNTNADAAGDLSDAVFLLNYLFAGGAPPPAPGPDVCGEPPEPGPLGCETPAC
jgi:hypothetical protein